MRHPIVNLVAAALLVATPAVAGAAAKPACKPLVTDAAGDAWVAHNAATNQSVPEVDAHEVDLATGAKTIVVSMSLGSVDFANQKFLTAGAAWSVHVQVWGSGIDFGRRMQPGASGPTYTDSVTVSRRGATAVAVPGVTVTVVGSSLRWTLPRAAIVPELTKKNGVFTEILGQTSTPFTTDYAPNNDLPLTATYKDRAPSCLKPA